MSDSIDQGRASGEGAGGMRSRALQDDCFQHDAGGQQLTHEEALALLRARLRPTAGVETTPLALSLGRILAEDIVAPRPIPAHDNAAVDGYSFAFTDYDRTSGATLPVSGRSAAGRPLEGLPVPGTAARIFTGAMTPSGHDAVVMQEDVELISTVSGTSVRIPPGLAPGANRRLAGEDVAAGQTLIEAGARLRPQDIAAIAATGRGETRCRTPLRVAIVSTGDEVIRPGAPFRPGAVFDANGPMLQALAGLSGARVSDLGVLPDAFAAVHERLRRAAQEADVLITSGGVSRGEEDHVGDAVRDLGSLHMWRLAIKPGRPMSFGQIGDCVFMGLPGNPVASFVCFMLYVRPALLALAGGGWSEPRRYPVRATFSLKRRPGRRDFLRGWLVPGPDGALWAEKYPQDGSGLISSLRRAEGLIEIAETVERVERNDLVPFIPFSEFGIAAA